MEEDQARKNHIKTLQTVREKATRNLDDKIILNRTDKMPQQNMVQTYPLTKRELSKITARMFHNSGKATV